SGLHLFLQDFTTLYDVVYVINDDRIFDIVRKFYKRPTSSAERSKCFIAGGVNFLRISSASTKSCVPKIVFQLIIQLYQVTDPLIFLLSGFAHPLRLKFNSYVEKNNINADFVSVMIPLHTHIWIALPVYSVKPSINLGIYFRITNVLYETWHP